jgi:histidyl-tRNA synthetase
LSDRIQAPRGTFDVLADEAHARADLEASAKQILERAGYERIETPTASRPTSSRRRCTRSATTPSR